mmetsp:Transcript_35504/g.78764  ORF Transcript_35504/g.78764 Transcript_35504/m.78764 type:complete len:258 (-) Transcript_35504:460-1233(-)
MGPRAGGYRGVGIRVGAAAHLVHVHACCIHHHLCIHVDLPPRDRVLALGTHHLAVLILDELCAIDVVGDHGARCCRRAGEGHVHARVIELAIIVKDRALERAPVLALLGQCGQEVDRLRRPHEARPDEVAGAGHQVVRLEACPVVGHLKPAVAGRYNGQGVRQMCSVCQESSPLLERLKHELQLVYVELEHSLLEVAHPAVHQLGGFGAGSGAKVLALHQHRAQAPGSCIHCTSCPRGSSPDNQKVERLVRSRLAEL